jgi:hypothetical protein
MMIIVSDLISTISRTCVTKTAGAQSIWAHTPLRRQQVVLAERTSSSRSRSNEQKPHHSSRQIEQ